MSKFRVVVKTKTGDTCISEMDIEANIEAVAARFQSLIKSNDPPVLVGANGVVIIAADDISLVDISVQPDSKE